MENKKKPIKKRINKLFDELQYEDPDTEPRKNDDELVGQGVSESFGVNGGVSDTVTTGTEIQEPDLETQEVDIISETNESAEYSAEDSESESDLSPEDLLNEVRHSLIDTQEAEEKQPKWWHKFGIGSRKGNKDANAPELAETMLEPEESEHVDVPVEMLVADPVKQDDEQVEYVEQLDELIDILEEEIDADIAAEEPPVVIENETTPAIEVKEQEVVDINEMKKRAFSARSSPEEEERQLSEVRAVALDEGEEVFVEVEAKAEDPMQDRMKAIENALRPYRRYFYFVFVFVSLIMVLLVSVSLYRVYQRSLPPPPVEEAPDLPYPVGMTLPGDLKFNLGKGKLQEGRWDPRGPEWLDGTEICRWIAIPYSRQLEAVVRTLTREDQIELTMSNNDTLAYTVNAIDQLSLEDMQKIDSGAPCILLVLAQADTDERWVVTAFP